MTRPPICLFLRQRRRSARRDFFPCWRSVFASRRLRSRSRIRCWCCHSRILGQTGESPLYGFALADAIGARLARMSSLVVRPSSSLMQSCPCSRWTRCVGQKLLVQFVLAGQFYPLGKGLRSELAVARRPWQSVSAGGAISVPSFDLVAVQTEICKEVSLPCRGWGGGCADLGESHAARALADTSVRSNICRPGRCSLRSCQRSEREATWTRRGRSLRA